MNPETTITKSQLELLCTLHGLEYHSSSRITVGFSHEVHKLNNHMVIKIYREDAKDKFQTELSVLSSKQAFPKPDIIAFSGINNPIHRSYIIMRFIEGRSLGACWHLANDKQRENIIQQLSSILKAINKINPSRLSGPNGLTWDESLMNRANTLIRVLFFANTISSNQKTAAARLFKTYVPSLQTQMLYPVNWDIHFDNLIVDDEFNIKAMIDLEDVQITALDFPLFVVKDMVNEPHRYMTEENEKFADKADYSKLWEWYKKYYPEMFNFKNLEKRIEAYEFLNILHLMQSWPHDKKLMLRFNEFIQRAS
ncbi:hypothetical protein EOL96_05155 [Candidatus Saccharibacteria bacterium]|nr:hypothetical protein [Candidatus Saccharibacteria bacterium]